MRKIVILIVVVLNLLIVKPLLFSFDATTDSTVSTNILTKHVLTLRPINVLLSMVGNTVVANTSFGISGLYMYRLLNIEISKTQYNLLSLYSAFGVSYTAGNTNGFSLIIDVGVGLLDGALLIGFGLDFIVQDTWYILYGITISSRFGNLIGGNDG